MEGGHFIDAHSAGTTITTVSGTTIGTTGINQSGGGGGGGPKVAYQISRVVPIASAASQSQIHSVAGEISTVEDDGDGGGTQVAVGTAIPTVLTNGLNGQVIYLPQCHMRKGSPSI